MSHSLTSKKAAIALFAGIVAFALAALALTGCSSSNNSNSDDKKITVAAVPTPHAEILNNAVAPILEKEGYTLEVKEFTDYVHANYFQHGPYLDNFNQEKGTHLVSVTAIHFEPMGIYSKSISDLKQLKNGAKVAVPNDATNEARALLLLQQEGLITLKDGVGVTATVNDIVSNPKNLTFNELEAANVPNVVDDVDIAIINGNYAIAAGFKVNTDALAVESADSEAAKTYANLLVVKDGNQDSDKIKALVEALNSDEVRDYINNTYEGAVVPVF